MANPFAAQELTGLPIEVSIDELIPIPAAAVAVVTSLALKENAGGTLVPAAGAIVHCASVTPHRPVPAELAVSGRLAVAKWPVSTPPTRRWFDVFAYVPLVGVEGTETSTLATHVLLAATLPLENETELAPAVGAKVGEPQPEVEKVAGVATTIWFPDSAGSGSVKLAPLTADGFGLDMTKVRVDVPPATAGEGENVFEIVSAAGSTMLATTALTPKSAL